MVTPNRTPSATTQPLPAVQTPVASAVSVNTRGATLLPEEGSHPDQRDSRAIYLPNHIEAVSHIAVDIGGSLAKLVYFTRAPEDASSPEFETSARAAGLRKDSKDSIFGGSGRSDRTSTPPLSAVNTASLGPSPCSTPFRSGTPVASGTLTPTSIHRGKHFDHGFAFQQGSPFSPADARPAPNAGPPKPAAPLPLPDPSITGAGAATSSAATADWTQTGHAAPMSASSSSSSSTASSRLPDSSMTSLRASFLKRRSLPPVLPGGRLNFVKFETEHIEQCVSFLAELLTLSAKANGVSLEEMRRGVKLTATGGGAHMYKELFERELGIEVQREDEMSCLITGLNFITLIPDEVFWLSDELVEQFRTDGLRATGIDSQEGSLPRPSPNPPSYQLSFDSSPSPKLPCLLVNIGSGVSIIRVDEFGAYERVSGTSLGGGTLWGLLSLLTGAGSFDEMLAMTERGDNAKVDMLVGDIYGQVGYNTLGLKSTTIASSFGKVFRRESSESGDEDEEDDGPQSRDRAPGVKSGPSEGEAEETEEHARARRNRERSRKQRAFRPEDICKSLLYAISNNIGQIAYMNAEKYGLDRIYFSGCFIRGHHATINTLSYAIRFWSKGTKRALFLRHEGYLGAVGAWIRQVGGEGSAPITSANGQEPSAAQTTTAPARPKAVRSASSSHTVVPDMAPLTQALHTPRAGLSNLVDPLSRAGDQTTEDRESEEKIKVNIAQLEPTDRAIIEPLLQPVPTASAEAPTEAGPTAAAAPPAPTRGRQAASSDSMASSVQDDWMSLLSGVHAAEQARMRADEALAQPPNGSTPYSGLNGSVDAGQDTAEEDEDNADQDDGDDEEEDGLGEEEVLQQLAAANPEIAALLAKLSTADGAADGLERRLDGLLERLDGLLERES